jgi:hypothetical protein
VAANISLPQVDLDAWGACCGVSPGGTALHRVASAGSSAPAAPPAAVLSPTTLAIPRPGS